MYGSSRVLRERQRAEHRRLWWLRHAPWRNTAQPNSTALIQRAWHSCATMARKKYSLLITALLREVQRNCRMICKCRLLWRHLLSCMKTQCCTVASAEAWGNGQSRAATGAQWPALNSLGTEPEWVHTLTGKGFRGKRRVTTKGWAIPPGKGVSQEHAANNVQLPENPQTATLPKSAWLWRWHLGPGTFVSWQQVKAQDVSTC